MKKTEVETKGLTEDAKRLQELTDSLEEAAEVGCTPPVFKRFVAALGGTLKTFMKYIG